MKRPCLSFCQLIATVGSSAMPGETDRRWRTIPLKMPARAPASFPAATAALVLLTLIAPTPHACGATPVLNVVLITADDMNFDSPGFTGSAVPEITPNLDRLAREGLRFVHAHVTVAVCQPSRECLMTGRYPHRNGATGFYPVRPEVPTLMESLSPHFSHSDWLSRLSDVRRVGVLAAALSACGLMSNPPGGFVISPEIPPAIDSRVKVRTLCGSASEQSVKFPG